MELHRHISATCARLPRLAILAALGLWLFCAGGCAMLPLALTGASFAMPTTASLAVTGVKGAYQTAYLASDERDMNTIVRDNMLSIKAKSTLLATPDTHDVQVHAYNGEVFAVGTVASRDDRDRVIHALHEVRGVGAVKGYIGLRDPANQAANLADNDLESRTRMSLGRYMLHKNSGVEVGAVNGDLCLMGVVGTHAEALDLIQYVESISGARARSLLSIRDEYATGRRQTNRLYLLESSDEPSAGNVSLQAEAAPSTRMVGMLSEAADPPLPTAPIFIAQSGPTLRAKASLAPPRIAPAQPKPALNKARAHIQLRLTQLAKAEASPDARAELLTLADQVAQDRDLSIADRLSVAAATAQHSRAKIQSLLALF